jgi:tetratricopeptide (TPR) repeat protein
MSWLAAIVSVPVYFNIYSEQIFDPNKIFLFRSIALLMAAALLWRAFEEGRNAWIVLGAPAWRLWVVRFAVLLMAGYVVSTMFSVAPEMSFWGAYIRRQGTYTLACYLVLFLAIVLAVRREEQLERIATAVLVAGLASASYSALQRLGWDPINWHMYKERIGGTAGNPIFSSAFLIMVSPIAMARLIEAWSNMRRARGGAQRKQVAAPLLLFTHGLVLILLLFAVLSSRSRGPLLAWGVGTVVLFVLLAVCRDLRRVRWMIAAAGSLGVLFVALVIVDAAPVRPLRQIEAFDRIARFVRAKPGSAGFRALLWQGSIDLLRQDRLRSVIGHGPETLYLVYPHVQSPLLARYEGKDAIPDRSHNEVLDSLVMTGVWGLATQLLVFAGVLHQGLRHLGLLDGRFRQRLFAALVTGGGLLGVMLPYFVEGTLRFSPLGLPLGLVVGFVTYALMSKRDRSVEGETLSWGSDLLVIALLSAVVTHFVEIQLGITVVATRLTFWACAALLVVLAASRRERGLEQIEPLVVVRTATVPQQFRGSILPGALLVALAMIVLTFNMWTPSNGPALLRVETLSFFCLTWALATVVSAPAASPGWLYHVGRSMACSGGIWLLFVLLYSRWLAARPRAIAGDPSSLSAVGQHLSSLAPTLHLSVFALIFLGAGFLALRARSVRRFDAPAWKIALCATTLLLSVQIAIHTNLKPCRADVISKQGLFYQKREKNLDGAIIAYRDAVQLQPAQDHYLLRLASALAVLAERRLKTGEPRWQEEMERARDLVERARQINPLDAGHAWTLAKLHRRWAELSDDPQVRSRERASAVEAYEEATTLAPRRLSILRDRAQAHRGWDEREEALRILARSLEAAPWAADLLVMRGDLHLGMGGLEEALRDYDAALRITRKLPHAWTGKAFALAELGRLEEAIEANRRVLDYAPDDLTTHRNLALLYEQAGYTALARRAARTALRLAPEEERPALRRFLRELEGGKRAGQKVEDLSCHGRRHGDQSSSRSADRG